ncbi:Gypsy retrotransposon integrase-like protein 1 [Marasmius crinis-equi]|uniref:Gypsy retrotransposon integrase-like protein 1 n=1 Tax=Marasmius crinis-equi TaxID=585013 RepID=A0ABR3FLL2_9AGAR
MVLMTRVQKRGPKSPYVENLEKKVRSLEDIIRKAAPHVNLDDLKQKEVTGVPSPQNMSNSTGSSPSADPADEESDEDDFAHIGLSEQFRKMTFKEDTIAQSFFGPSSGFMLLKRAHASKTEYTGHESIHNKELKREDYWRIHSWETEFRSRASEHYTFPEHDLLWHLINLYFEKINVFFPILHGPTFRKAMMQGQHLVDPHFGGMVLMVCALGAKYSDDPRVFYVPGKELSAGWGWFRQVRMTRGSLFAEPSIYELQFYCMTVIFIIGTSSPQVSYMLIGIGIRYAIELGVHRRKPEGTRHTAQHEQERRVFWVLLSLDRCVCNFTGRPSALRDEDFDQELPADCDDEYWENPDPELAFKQPPGKPSSISCFILYLKLCEILAFALRTLYSIKKSKMMLGLVGNQWEQRIISELDSSLNNWINSIPEHLRWDPSRENMVFFNQSAFLQVNYYNVQIQTHRPFIMKPSPLMFPSLAICTNAARSCINVLHRHSQRAQLAIPHTFYACFAAGVVLLTHIWNSKSAGLKIDVPREMSDVHKLMQVLSGHDKRWTSSGRFLDIFCELARGLQETKEEAEPAPLQSETQSLERFRSPPVHPEYHVWQDVASMEEEQLPSLPYNSTELGQERFGYQYSMPQPMEQQHPPQPQPMQSNTGGGAYGVHPAAGYGGAYNYQVQQQQQQQHQQQQQQQQHYGSATAPNGWDDPGWMPNVANIPSGYSLYDWGQYLDNGSGMSSYVNAGRSG